MFKRLLRVALAIRDAETVVRRCVLRIGDHDLFERRDRTLAAIDDLILRLELAETLCQARAISFRREVDGLLQVIDRALKIERDGALLGTFGVSIGVAPIEFERALD